MMEGRFKQVFRAWLGQQSPTFRDDIEVVAMHGFTASKPLPLRPTGCVKVMDPFHIVQLAGDALDVPDNVSSSRPSTTVATPAPPFIGSAAPSIPVSRCSLIGQRARIDAVFMIDEHIEVEATWAVYQRIAAAYRHPVHRREAGAALGDRFAAPQHPQPLLPS